MLEQPEIGTENAPSNYKGRPEIIPLMRCGNRGEGAQ